MFQLECTSPNSTQRFFHTEVQICFRWVVGFEAVVHVLLVLCCWLLHQHCICSRHCSGLGTKCRSPGQAAQCLWLLLVLAELAQPLCSLGMGRSPPCTPCSVQPPALDCVVPPAVLQLQHTIPVALNLGTESSSGMYFSVLLLHNLKSLLICACRCCHINILQLLGFSVETGLHCLIYPYLPNGSLQNKLQCHVSTNLDLPPTCDCKSSPGIQGNTIASLWFLRNSCNKRCLGCKHQQGSSSCGVWLGLS